MSIPVRGSVPRPVQQPKTPATTGDAGQTTGTPGDSGAEAPSTGGGDEFQRVQQGGPGFGRLMGPGGGPPGGPVDPYAEDAGGGSQATDGSAVDGGAGAVAYSAQANGANGADASHATAGTNGAQEANGANGTGAAGAVAQQPVTGPPGSVQNTSAVVANRFAEVEAVGKRIAEGKGEVSDADRKAWEDGQTALRQDVTALAAAVAKLPPNSPQRAEAQAKLQKMSEQLAALELPVLARLDKGFGESYAFHRDKTPGSEGAALAARLKIYGISEKELETYVMTGKEPKGLQKALADARNRGEWPGLGVVRAAYQMRADYLRATTAPEDVASRELADKLDSSAGALMKNRAAIHMQWGAETFFKLTDKYPDESKRTPKVKAQIEEARRAIASVRSRAVEQVLANPARYGKNSPTRKLAADALRMEAGMLSGEASKVMDREAKDLAKATEEHNKGLKAGEPKVVPPPPKLHPDLVEGGAVDQKRAQAVEVDPRLKDVVNGGQRAVDFAREVRQTKKLRLGIDEQQIAHLQSKNPREKPPAELVGRMHKQLDSLFRDTLETQDKLNAQKPGSLSVDQTKYLAELAGDSASLASKVARERHQKSAIDTEANLARANDQMIYRGQAAIEEATKELDKKKLERIEKELAGRALNGHDAMAQSELIKFRQDPAAYAKAAPDTKGEAEFRKTLVENGATAAKLREGTKEAVAKSDADRAWSEKVSELGGLNTDAEMAAGLAKDRIAQSEAHMKAIPEKGPERLGKLEAALDHQQATLAVNGLVRNNADARIGRAVAGHQAVVISNRMAPQGLENYVANSAEFVDKVTAEETQVKQAAFKEAKDAAMTADSLRKKLGEEVDAQAAKQPRSVRERQAAAIQQYKDGLAVQQAGMHGRVAEMGADLEPKQAQLHLDRAGEIVKNELPYEQVSRIDDKAAQAQHARNMARGEALAALGEAGIAVAQRAGTIGGVEQGVLIHGATNTASQASRDLDHTLTIDTGGAAERLANKEKVAELRERGSAITSAALELDRQGDTDRLADALEQELAKDVAAYDKTRSQLEKAIRDERGDAFGFFMNGISKIRGALGFQGGDLNAMSVEDGLAWLNLAWKGGANEKGITDLASTMREMKKAGVPGHVILAALRDPKLKGMVAYGDPKKNDEMTSRLNAWRDELKAVAKDRYGADINTNGLWGMVDIRAESPLGKAFESMRSNRTDDLIGILRNEGTDLLAAGREELGEMFGKSNEVWQDIAPYAALSQVVDQVVISMVSGAALAGAFTRIASFTKIPGLFNAARGAATNMSMAGKLVTLGGINAAEAGLGMLTGAAMGKAGEAIFGKGSTGAKLFEAVGGGFQLSSASKVALRSGFGFQAGLGLTMGGAPILAKELGMDPDLAAKLGTAAGVFIPTVLGTVGNLKTVRRAEGVMNEMGLDATKAKQLMGEVFTAEGQSKSLDVDGFVRERAGKLIAEKFPELPADARQTLADTVTMDKVRGRVTLQLPGKGASSAEYIKAVEGYYGKVQGELVKEGIHPDQAKTMVLGEKEAMYREVLDKSNGVLGAGAPGGNSPDPRLLGGSSGATRNAIDQLAQSAAESLPEVQVLHPAGSAAGRRGQHAEEGLRLLYMDKPTDSAVVMRENGDIVQVKASEIVFVHDKRALGLMTPAMKQQYDMRLHQMTEPERMDWSDMLGAANGKSQEHVQLLRKMLAGGAKLDEIKQWHDWAQNIPQHELGKYMSPGTLQQHLASSCSAATAQVIESILFPQAGNRLRDVRAQAAEQAQVLQRNGGASAVRRDPFYLQPPPLGNEVFTPARPMDSNKPAELDGTLTMANRGDFHIHDVGQVDRRVLASQLAEAAVEGPVYLELTNATTRDVTVIEVVGAQQVPDATQPGGYRTQLEVRLANGSSSTVTWDLAGLLPGQDGLIRLQPDHVLTSVAVPPDRPIKAAEKGMLFSEDAQIANMIRAATGKNITSHEVEGQAALSAIHRSVQDVGFAGVAVGWDMPTSTAQGAVEPRHHITVIGSRENNGVYSFDVQDSTTGKVRTLTGDELLRYHDGVSFDGAGNRILGTLRGVMIPDDVAVGAWPTAPAPPRTQGEAAARHVITEHQPHKLSALAAIDRLPDAQMRHVATLMLRGEVDSLRVGYLEKAMQSGPDFARRALLELSDPNFSPVGKTPHDWMLQSLGHSRSLPDTVARLEQLDSFKALDTDTQLEVAELFVTHPDNDSRRALLALLPTIGELPESAAAYALQRMKTMNATDLAAVANLHARLEPPRWSLATADDAMRYTTQLWGRDPSLGPVTTGAGHAGKVVKAGSSTAIPVGAIAGKIR